MKVVCRFAQIREKFRVAEIESLFSLFDPNAEIESYSDLSPFSLVTFKYEFSALQVVSRCFIILYICKFVAFANSFEALLSLVKALSDEFLEYRSASFKFEVDAFGKSLEQKEQIELINSFSFMPLKGPIF